MAHFTAAEKQACAEREAKLRDRVYPRLVEQSKMSPDKAKSEIALMLEIRDDYAAKAEAERLL